MGIILFLTTICSRSHVSATSTDSQYPPSWGILPLTLLSPLANHCISPQQTFVDSWTSEPPLVAQIQGPHSIPKGVQLHLPWLIISFSLEKCPPLGLWGNISSLIPQWEFIATAFEFPHYVVWTLVQNFFLFFKEPHLAVHNWLFTPTKL